MNKGCYVLAALVCVTSCSRDAGQRDAGEVPSRVTQAPVATLPVAAAPEIDTAGMQAYAARIVTEARTAVVASPSSAAAWGHLGKVCDVFRLLDCAQVSYSEAARLAPDDFKWPYLLGGIREAQGAEIDDVSGYLTTAMELNPEYAAVYFRLGEAQLRAGESEAAQRNFEKALAIDPNLAIVHLSLGRTLIGMGQLEEALQHLERARRIGPPDVGVETALASVYGRLGQRESARQANELAKDLKRVVALPDSVRFEVDALATSPAQRRVKVDQLLKAGDIPGAITELRFLTDVEPNDARTQFFLGQALFETGQLDAAAGPLLKAVELEPKLHRANGLLGAIATEKGWHDRAVEYYKLCVEAAPDEAEYHARLASELGKQNRPGEAHKEFERARVLGELSAKGYAEWGDAQYAVGNIHGAVERYRRALALDPDSAATHAKLGLMIDELGDKEEAMRHYRRALALDPTNAVASRLAGLKK